MIVRLPEWLTRASCLQSWLQAMNVGTEILQVAEKHTNYCQKEMCVLTPGQRGGSSDRLLAGAMARPLVREAWPDPKAECAASQSHWLLVLRYLCGVSGLA